MTGAIGSAASRIQFNPADVTDLPQALVTVRLQVAALKTEQDMIRMQGAELARLIEPNKGGRLDARA